VPRDAAAPGRRGVHTDPVGRQNRDQDQVRPRSAPDRTAAREEAPLHQLPQPDRRRSRSSSTTVRT
jgi:hypothetical protein